MLRPVWIAFSWLAAGCTQPTTGDKSSETGDTPPPAQSVCETEAFGRQVPWDAVGPYGTRRHDVAEDFSVELDDGAIWTLSERWTGCESYVFVPDGIDGGADNALSIWSRDLDALVDASPDNVHYFFVSVETDAPSANGALDALATERDDVLASLHGANKKWWTDHLHIVKKRADKLDNWVGDLLRDPVGMGGFAIDREQHVRGLGSLADVSLYNPSLSWPWENSLAYAAKEVEMYNVEADRLSRFDPATATVVPVYGGEVLDQGYAETDVTLPSADQMTGFDTLEIDVEMRCPDHDKAEFDNCGAWDYLAYLWVQQGDGSWTELGRFITSYHRETHWVLDATTALPYLLDGGARHFKWEWAPPWNTQPTETYLSLRFSNQGKGVRPVSATIVATGGSFSSAYNDGRLPVDVLIPSDAAKVELVAVVTGHGAGTNQCSEFCDHQHEFTVGASTHLIEFPEAGNDDGCATAGMANQMTPNQWGTWWFGRGGWCPGQPVAAHVVDITGDVTPGGTASIAYRGLYGGGTPPDGSGDIVLNASVVVYEASP